MDDQRDRTLLPHWLALLYGLAIVYASLQPFAPWIEPAPGTPFWTFAPWPPRWTRFDVIANLMAYVPFGMFAALLPRRATLALRTGVALAMGLALSFCLETLQTFMPPRDANLIDLMANSGGALIGGFLSAVVARADRNRGTIVTRRQRIFLPGRLGDLGIALLALWLAAQVNPGISLFAMTFDAVALPAQPAPSADADSAALLIGAMESAFQVVGVGLFLALLLRERRHIGGAVLLLVGMALLVKGIAALLLLKPAVWEAWLKPAVSLGTTVGLLVLLFAIFLPRPVQIAVCATALLSSLLAPLLAAGLPSARAPLTLFNWRYGHLLNFNGLTQTVLMLWPMFAAVWLFILAGQPAWGAPGGKRHGGSL